MRNVLSIMRRELLAYFTSPIGYLFIMVFVTVSVGLYITTFFAFPVADMRQFFGNLPLMLCIFIPAVTMRVWAEERKENTWEMLLTFPMKAWELVLGKYLASFIFFLIALAATFTVPAMLISLGNPDAGAIAGGYLGTILLGAMFLALGIFVSGFFKDQIVAFVITLLACFLLFLLGTDFVAGTIDATLPGVGSFLSDVLGLLNHYNSFTIGVVELVDIAYFLVWTGLFLFLNILYVDGRNRPNVQLVFGSATALCLGIGLAFNWLATNESLVRLDLTEDKIYTVSDASEDILASLPSPVQVTYYVSPQDGMPTQLRALEQDVTAKLRELEIASGGRLQHKVVHLEAANLVAAGQRAMTQPEEDEGEDDLESQLEERQLEKGVTPFNVQAVGEDLTTTNQLIYSSIGIATGPEAEELVNGILPQNLPELEYRVVSTAYKMTREEPPTIAVVAPDSNFPPEQLAMLRQMGQQVPNMPDPYQELLQFVRQEGYQVQRVQLTRESPLPEDFDAMVVLSPSNLNERQRWEINRVLRRGIPVFMGVQQYTWNYRVQQGRQRAELAPQNPGVNPLLEQYGLTVEDEDILMDVNYVPLSVQSGTLADLLSGGQPFDLPTHMILPADSMQGTSPITSRLDSLFYIWGAPIELDEDTLGEYGLDVDTLITTTERAWVEPQSNIDYEPGNNDLQQFPVMVRVTGQFPDAYADEERPDWPAPQPTMPGQPAPPAPPEEEPAEPVEPAPGQLLLIGSGSMFEDNFFRASPGNLDLLLKSLDAIALDERVVEVRSRRPINRVIDSPEAATRTFWQVINYGLANVVVATAGIGLAVYRRRSRDAYTTSFTQAGNKS